jgi:ankyrin repeat protein
MLLEHNADVHIRNHDGRTSMHAATCPDFHRDQVDIMQVLLEHGAIVDAEDNLGRTPLQVALEKKRDDIVTWLKEHGATR